MIKFKWQGCGIFRNYRYMSLGVFMVPWGKFFVIGVDLIFVWIRVGTELGMDLVD